MPFVEVIKPWVGSWKLGDVIGSLRKFRKRFARAQLKPSSSTALCSPALRGLSYEKAGSLRLAMFGEAKRIVARK